MCMVNSTKYAVGKWSGLVVVVVQLYVISKSNLLYFWKVRKVVQEKMKSECLQL